MLHPIALTVCHDCDRREPNCTSNCLCLESGETYVSQAKAYTCPLGKFPANPIDPRPVYPMPEGYDGDYTKDSGGSDGCNCA